jgi:hypothetical protein
VCCGLALLNDSLLRLRVRKSTAGPAAGLRELRTVTGERSLGASGAGVEARRVVAARATRALQAMAAMPQPVVKSPRPASVAIPSAPSIAAPIAADAAGTRQPSVLKALNATSRTRAIGRALWTVQCSKPFVSSPGRPAR